jgi:hypothetical protein
VFQGKSLNWKFILLVFSVRLDYFGVLFKLRKALRFSVGECGVEWTRKICIDLEKVYVSGYQNQENQHFHRI